MKSTSPPPSSFPSSGPVDLRGVLLGGRYRIREPLAQGGMGTVLLGTDEHTGTEVAIKVLRRELAYSDEAMARFRREVRVLASLDSPHIVKAFDAGGYEGMPYLVMERLSGRGLDELVATGAVGPRRALELVVRLLEGLAVAHAAGIIHRDLKPSNVWITDDDEVKILDFGVAKMLAPTEAPGDVDGKLTGTGAVLGSPAYMSPEQLVSSKEADERADVWSVGVLLYEVLTGKMLFGAETVGGIFANVIRMDIPSLRDALPGASPELEHVLSRCLERDPALRIGSAGALAVKLRALLEGDARGESLVGTAGSDAVPSPRAAGAVPTEAPTVMLRGPATSGGPSRVAMLVAFVALLVGTGAAVLMMLDHEGSSSPAAERAPQVAATTAEAPSTQPSAPVEANAAAVAEADGGGPAVRPEPSASAPMPSSDVVAVPTPPSSPLPPTRPAPAPPTPANDQLWESSRQ